MFGAANQSDTNVGEAQGSQSLELNLMANPQDDTIIEEVMRKVCKRFARCFMMIPLDDPKLVEYITALRVFLQQPELAEAFLKLNTLKVDNQLAYMSTLLGSIMSISSLPRTLLKSSFFQQASRSSNSEHQFLENQIGVMLTNLGKEIHKMFLLLLKEPRTRTKFLDWLGRCASSFKDCRKIWSNHLLMTSTPIGVSDGFLMNMLTVMLHLCEPFIGSSNPIQLGEPTAADGWPLVTDYKKLLKIDPRYCKISPASASANASASDRIRQISNMAHFRGLSDETFLVDCNESEPGAENIPLQANFISECFYGTHQVMTYSFRSMYERFYKLTTNLNDTQRLLQEVTANPQPSSLHGPSHVDLIRRKMDFETEQFLNLKAVLLVPSRINMMLHLSVSTAAYLNHLVMCRDYNEANEAKEIKIPTKEAIRDEQLSPTCLRFIPEMLVENIIDFFVFLKNFNEQALIQKTVSLEPLMTMIIVFMGNQSLMKNPHLRARFAEILECLMPHQAHHHNNYSNQIIGCESLFTEHPLADELMKSLVNVFVSIEITGEQQFEQKFTYRRPMYVILKYLWDKKQHRDKLIELSVDAERNIDSARLPLFLRFINLLMNDAIHLLDEALQYMSQLRETQLKRESEAWTQMPQRERAQQDAIFNHTGRVATFHNVLGLSTIGTLAWLTSEIKTIFCHPSLVARIANMLNYFLEHLVGPKKRNFKVKDMDEYEFKPKDIVDNICQIYINLGCKERNEKYHEFCSAVSNDGRSYSSELLPQACEVLFRTGKSALAIEFQELAKLIEKVALKNSLDEIPMEHIPDTFLDPIMSTLMTDPVLLPSSRIILDRSTIARHLLSDQTDPFNRSPLSMEDVISQTDLKAQIEQFILDNRARLTAENTQTP